MYLTSWEEEGYARDENGNVKETKFKTSCRGYSFDVINKLTDDNYLYHIKDKAVTITPEDEKLAKKLMEKYLRQVYMMVDFEKSERIEKKWKNCDDIILLKGLVK